MYCIKLQSSSFFIDKLLPSVIIELYCKDIAMYILAVCTGRVRSTLDGKEKSSVKHGKIKT